MCTTSNVLLGFYLNIFKVRYYSKKKYL